MQQCNSCRFENQFAVLRCRFDAITRLEAAFEQLRRERIEQVLLDRALERTRAELRIVAFLGQQRLRGLVEFQFQILLL